MPEKKLVQYEAQRADARTYSGAAKLMDTMVNFNAVKEVEMPTNEALGGVGVGFY